VKCPRCQRDNEPDATFCTQCGGRLERLCPQCRTANVGDARFCKRCGTALEPAPPPTAPVAIDRTAPPRSYTPKHLADKILGSRGALEGERKQVTVVFVDVSGFTSLSERLDPEDVHRMMTRAFELMLAEVHRYEGTVNQFLGDGIMALFGAPIAHEDHAVRALHAALGIRAAMGAYAEELQRRRGIVFEVRQGVNTGPVVVGSIGTDLRMDYTAVGDTTNVAARLLQAAERGRILLSEATHRLTAGYFHTRPLGDLHVKGKAEPIQGFELIAARSPRTRLDVSAERGLTPYVGRERELQTLLQCFERAKVGHGQVVFIVGEAGIGKSRLLHEFRRRLGDEATWVEGRCMSFGRSMPFHAIIDMVKRTFRIEEGDPESVIAGKLERGVILLGEDLRAILPYLHYLLSIDPGESVATMDPQQRRGEVFDALRRLLVRAAEVRPQVVVHEDVHWIDSASEESLLFTADSIPTNRILHVLTYRPGYKQPFGEHSFHTRIALPTLSAEDSVQMAQAVLDTDSLPEDLRALIVRKAEGNPFFVEEVVKSLQEIGAIRRLDDRYVLARRLDEIVIPDTIQDVIMARIDRLAEAPKKTLQLASVIGREFTRRLLDRIGDIREGTEALLRDLKAIELIYEKALFPELAYMFKHALTHEVAYNSLLVQRRKELHGIIARAVEELYAERLAEQYEVLAYHFGRADDTDKALEYLLKAAQKAASAFANREAVALYEQALEACRRQGDAVDHRVVMSIQQALAGLGLVLSDFERSRAAAGEAMAIARRLGDTTSEASALATMGFATAIDHRFDRAIEYCREAVRVASAVDAKPIIANAYLTTGLVHEVLGRLDEGREDMAKAIAISRAANDIPTYVQATFFDAHTLNWAGKYREANERHAEALQLARQHRLLFPLLWGFFEYGVALTGGGRYDDAVALLEEGIALCEKMGEEIMRHRMLNTLGWLYLELGDLDAAIDFNRRGAEAARKRGDDETIANPEINLGDAFMAKGDLTLAAEFLDGVHARVRKPTTSEWMKWRYSMHLFASLGELALARGERDRAHRFADDCLEIASRTSSRRYLVRGWRLRGQISLAQGQGDDAERMLRQALEMAEMIQNPPQRWLTHAALGDLLRRRGDSDGAQRAYGAARAIVDATRSGLRTPSLRAIVETAPLTRRIREAAGER
jgi:class 3 adenylate cyclase/tetratricopeptide (TPR) repeat protein